jgi:hypothetical protein
LTAKGWVSVNVRQEWADWIDQYLKENPHGLTTRDAVIAFALDRLRASTQDLSVEQLEQIGKLASETYFQLEEIRKRRGGQSPRTTPAKPGSR